jgi:hypothetical protein
MPNMQRIPATGGCRNFRWKFVDGFFLFGVMISKIDAISQISRPWKPGEIHVPGFVFPVDGF